MEQKLNSNTEAGLNYVQPHLNKTSCWAKAMLRNKIKI